jgi:hypothetical protein
MHQVKFFIEAKFYGWLRQILQKDEIWITKENRNNLQEVIKYRFQCKLMHILAHMLNWHHTWDFKCPCWMLLWRAMKKWKEGTSSVDLSASSENHWNIHTEKLESVLAAWFIQECERPCTMSLVWGTSNFLTCSGWIERYKRRQCLQKSSGENRIFVLETVEDWKNYRFANWSFWPLWYK